MPDPSPPAAAPPAATGAAPQARATDLVARLERERAHCLQRARGTPEEGEAPPAHYSGRALAYLDAVRMIREAGLSGALGGPPALDFDDMLAAIEARGTALARAMPNEAAALRVMSAAVERLKALGFRDVAYCPKDGAAREFVEAGSGGIHTGSRWRDGGFWLADGGDLWPSHPILFRERPASASLATTAGGTP